MQISKFSYQVYSYSELLWEDGEECGFTYLNAMYLSMQRAGFRSGLYSFKRHVFIDKIATFVIFSLWLKYVCGFNSLVLRFI